MELEVAVSSEDSASALAHLELARMHRARRHFLARQSLDRMTAGGGARVLRTDKEA